MVRVKFRNSKHEIRNRTSAGVLSILLLLVSFATLVRAQDVHATARVDSNKVTIGDWLQLRIEIEHPSNVTVTIPSLADSLEGMEIVKRDSEIVKQNGSTILRAMTFTITSFDSGTHVIPPLTIHYSSVGDTTKRVVETSPVPIFVRGIAVDTSKEIRDIKAPQSVPMTFADVLPYIVGVVLLAGLVWLFFYIRKKRKLGERIIPETPPRPPHEVALEALRSLESEKLWQRGKVKEYHSSLTDIIRTYIERRFKVMAMESTSDEILHSLRLSIRSNDVYEKLKEMLLCADLVKFAKYQPDANDHEASLADAFAFVEATWKEYAEPAKQMEGAEVKP